MYNLHGTEAWLFVRENWKCHHAKFGACAFGRSDIRSSLSLARCLSLDVRLIVLLLDRPHGGGVSLAGLLLLCSGACSNFQL